jgi:hypothetical protein
MSRAEESKVGQWPNDQDPSEQKTADAPRRKLSLASISIPTILKRKPLPVNSPVLAQRQRSFTDNLTAGSPSARQPRLANILTPIPSPASLQLVLRDLDRYAIQPAVSGPDPGEYQSLIVVHIATLMAILPCQE